jgi:nucleoside-diphosphate-sugar epimerase
MHLFVTGGTGFIGGHFLHAARADGHRVTALRRPGSVPQRPMPEGIQWLEKPVGDVSPADCCGCEAVVHFSSCGVSPRCPTWRNAFEHNVFEQVSMLVACAEAGIGKFVICGSCFEYGLVAAALDEIPPDAPLIPTGPYAASKAAGAVASLALAREMNLSLAYLRVFHAFGVGQDPANFWPSLSSAAMSGSDFPMTPGQQVRDFIPVQDVAHAFLHVCTNHTLVPGMPEVHNVGTGRPMTILAFAQHWWKAWGARGRLLPGAIPYRAGEVMRYVPKLTLKMDASSGRKSE